MIYSAAFAEVYNILTEMFLKYRAMGQVQLMINVAAAIIENEEGQILIARRKKGKAQAGFWEFPGGKIEANETAEQCLKRELLEEMEIEINPYLLFATNDFAYVDKVIHLVAYRATYICGKITLHDHDSYKWVHAEQMMDYLFAPADIKFVEQLMILRNREQVKEMTSTAKICPICNNDNKCGNVSEK